MTLHPPVRAQFIGDERTRRTRNVQQVSAWFLASTITGVVAGAFLAGGLYRLARA